MSRWAFLPLFLVGRINLVKMVILHKFLYLFEHIPIRINKSFFNGLDSILRAFIWGNKPARLRKSKLPKAKGGLSLFSSITGPATLISSFFGIWTTI